MKPKETLTANTLYSNCGAQVRERALLYMNCLQAQDPRNTYIKAGDVNITRKIVILQLVFSSFHQERKVNATKNVLHHCVGRYEEEDQGGKWKNN